VVNLFRISVVTNHYEASLGMHTGSFTFARPSLGSWVSYGLGTENRDLPSFVVISPGLPYTGTQAWASDFLPASHQGTHIAPGSEPIANLRVRAPLAERGVRCIELISSDSPTATPAGTTG